MAKRGVKNQAKMSYSVLAVIFIIVIIAAILVFYKVPATGKATTTTDLSATIASIVTCSASPSSLDFGGLTLGSDKTTTSGTTVDMTGSNANTKLEAAVTTSSSWIDGFKSANVAWGLLCPASSGTAASGLANGVGYKRLEFDPTKNTCRNGAGSTGTTVGLGTGTIPSLAQQTTTHKIFSKIKAPTGTTPGTFSSTITFTCSEITGPSAGLSFEVGDIEFGVNPANDGKVTCDGSTPNIFVAQAGIGASRASITDAVTSVIYICDSTGNCAPATVAQKTAGAPCGNTLPPIISTPNNNDVVCGEFTCPAGLTPGANAFVFIETGPLATPAGAVVQTYKTVTLV